VAVLGDIEQGDAEDCVEGEDFGSASSGKEEERVYEWRVE
jgi:hypothetical protein